MKVSIVVPFHNEEKIVELTINKLIKVMKRGDYDYEIIPIDDNSNDNTGILLDNLSKKHKRVRSMHIKNNTPGPSGLGTALKFGFKQCSGDVIITFMGDLSDNPNDIPKFIKKVSSNFDVVCGSRFIKGGKVIGYPKIKLICNRIYNLLFSFLFCIPTNDISNGFKAYKKTVLHAIEPTSKGFEMTSEIVLKAHIKNFRITEVPVSWHEREDDTESKFGSFISPSFIFFKLPKIGFSYLELSLKLWFKFLFKFLRQIKYE